MFYLAKCHACVMELPFANEQSRAKWVSAHGLSPHFKAMTVDPNGLLAGDLPRITTREVPR